MCIFRLDHVGRRLTRDSESRRIDSDAKIGIRILVRVGLKVGDSPVEQGAVSVRFFWVCKMRTVSFETCTITLKKMYAFSRKYIRLSLNMFQNILVTHRASFKQTQQCYLLDKFHPHTERSWAGQERFLWCVVFVRTCFWCFDIFWQLWCCVFWGVSMFFWHLFACPTQTTWNWRQWRHTVLIMKRWQPHFSLPHLHRIICHVNLYIYIDIDKTCVKQRFWCRGVLYIYIHA